MNFGLFLKEVGRGERGARDLGFDDARRLFGAMLDGGVPELELGALLLAFRFKTESLTELQGFHAALDERVVQLKSPDRRLRPVVVPSYNGARRQANLMPLLVLPLCVPVLIFGAAAVEASRSGMGVAGHFSVLGAFACWPSWVRRGPERRHCASRWNRPHGLYRDFRVNRGQSSS